MQTTKIALFPLEIFLLPGENINLHIFEERYKQLIKDCENNFINFGIPFVQEGKIMELGCTVHLKQILKKYKSGEMDIIVEATEFFKLTEYFSKMEDKMYPYGEINTYGANEKVNVTGTSLFKLFKEFCMLKFDENPNYLDDSRVSVYDIAKILKLETPEKYQLVATLNQKKKEAFLIEKVKFNLLLLKQKNSIKQNIFLN
jgi:Lon protease-like protein